MNAIFPLMKYMHSLWEKSVGLLQNLRTREMFVSMVLAFAAALSVVAFMWAAGYLFNLIYGRAAEVGIGRFALFSFLGITAAALVSGWLMYRFCPNAAGSGIPEIKVAFWKEIGFVPWRAVWVKFLAGVISIGGGISLGREGPCVFFGGGLASTLAGRFGVPKRGRRAAAIGGAAAGLAAAFNTPLAAVAFALEEIMADFGSRLLGKIILAAVVGALVTHALLGPQPSFLLPSIGEPRWQVYLAVPFVAVAGALVASIFQASVLRLRKRVALTRLPPWLRPMMGAWVTWALGIVVFALIGRVGVFGLGYGDLSAAMAAGIGAKAALLLMVAKLIATIFAYGCGGCGGIFSPLLFLGAMTGFGMAIGFDPWLGMTQQEHVLLACVGMVACLGGAVRAPWSALLIVFEMTHEFALIPALLFATLISQAIVRRLGNANFYDAVLLQDGHRISSFAPPQRLDDLNETAVINVATRDPVVIRAFSPKTIEQALQDNPYERFPVMEGGVLRGIASRTNLQRFATDGVPPILLPATIIRETATLHEAAQKLVDSESGMLLIIHEGQSDPLGVLTLHDILRLQTSFRE